MRTIKFCLDCEHEIDLGPSPKIKQRITCPHCGVTLEVINIDPLGLDWVYDGPATDPKVFNNWWSVDQQNQRVHKGFS